MEAESLPPGPRPSVDRGDYDRPARCLLVEIDGCRKYVSDQCRTDPKTGVSPVDRKAADQQGRDWVGSAFRQSARRGRAIDSRHSETGVGDDLPIGSGNHPGRRGIASAVLPGVPPEPLVEGGLAGIEAGAVVTSRIEQLGTA